MELQANDIAFHYKHGPPVFSRLSLSLKTPEVLCILGPNGTGKSTLLKCLCGLHPVTQGRVLCGNTDIRRLGRRDLAQRIAYIPQSHNPTFPFSVLDVVSMGRTAHIGYLASPGKSDAEKAMENMAFLGIGHLAEKPYTNLSGGERQLVMLAAALTQEPQFMLLDEPTSHLDFGNQHRFLQVVKTLRDRGIGVLMTSHLPDHAFAVADQVAVMQNGGIDSQGVPDDVITPERMKSLYGIPVEILQTAFGKNCVADIRG